MGTGIAPCPPPPAAFPLPLRTGRETVDATGRQLALSAAQTVHPERKPPPMKNSVRAIIIVASLLVSYAIWRLSPDYIRRGGPLLVLGLAFLFLAVTIALDRWLALRAASGRAHPVRFAAALRDKVRAGDVDGALADCRAQGGSLANVLGAGLQRYRRLGGGRPGTVPRAGVDEVRRVLRETAALECPNLEQNLNALSMLASVATMLGLLGTTIGMIRSFNALSRAGAPDATQLALGISEALVNTALGLVTAIAATMLYNHFTTQVDALVTSMDEGSYELLQVLEGEGEAATGR